MDYLWAALCILGAVFFIFRDKLAGRMSTTIHTTAETAPLHAVTLDIDGTL